MLTTASSATGSERLGRVGEQTATESVRAAEVARRVRGPTTTPARKQLKRKQNNEVIKPPGAVA